MIKRIVLFGFGALISMFFLSLGPENRLKNTFYAYLDYFNLDKRVIYHLSKEDPFFSTKSECQIVYYNLDKSKILSVLDGGEVNFSKSNKKQDLCPIYVVENDVDNSDKELCQFAWNLLNPNTSTPVGEFNSIVWTFLAITALK